jgi:hypothetical protein
MKGNLVFPLFACVVAIGSLSACSDSTPTALPPPQLEVALAAELPPAGARGVTVMTRNLMFGGSLTGLVTSTDPIPVRWATFWADIQAANFPERAGEFAREIAATSPALVGLQEVPLLRIQDPSDAITGGTTPATTVLMDFLAILHDSLVGRGLSYQVAIARPNTDVELPLLVAGTTSQYVDMRYTDRDVILARTDITTEHPLGATYAARVSAPLNDGTLSFTARSQRGWASIEAVVGGVRYRFVTTHLERASGGGLTLVSEAQATELIAAMQAETLPVILVCDCNSRADGTGSRSYGWLVATAADGGADSWMRGASPTLAIPDTRRGYRDPPNDSTSS